jgi:Uma2 family endonuclease
MSDREQVEHQIAEVLATETNAISLSDKLFRPDGLFNQLAETEQERRTVAQSPLFQQAQRRLTELQRSESATTMSTTTRLTAPDEEIEYPDSDGEPMAENTLQYEWITLIKGGLEIVFCDDPDVFVAGDLFWYPIQGDNQTRRAPDVLVAFGRPKGHRSAYLQWREAGVAPQVVFEILSPSNRGEELALKFQFYDTYGVEGYYIYDPDFQTLEGWLRDAQGQGLRPIPAMSGWVSPRLGVRFELVEDELRLYGPDGRPFVSMAEYARQAEEQRQRADQQQQRADRLAAQLRALGIEPES